MPASERLKAASGDCAGLQANRPRRSRFQSSVRFSAIGTKSGIALRGKKKHTLPKRIYFYHILCRQRRHNKSALSFDAEKEGASCGASATGWRIGLILRTPCSAAARALPRKTTCGGFWYFWPQKYIKNFFLCFSMAKSSKSHPTDSDGGGRKAESGVGRLSAGLQANRPRRSRFQPFVRFPAIGTKSGIALRVKRMRGACHIMPPLAAQ